MCMMGYMGITKCTLFKDLKGTLENDELHLIHLLLDDVQISVKLENETGKLLKLLIRSPQGDACSKRPFLHNIPSSHSKKCKKQIH